MNGLINIKQRNGQNVVSARELHKFLEVATEFAKWIKRMFEYGFEEGHDYSLVKIGERSAHNKINYALTIDCAKEIAMLQRSDKGKEARKYFIRVEKEMQRIKELKQEGEKALPDFNNPAEAARAWAMQYEQKQLLENTVKEQAPKVKYHDEVLTSTSTYNTNLIAKELGMSAVTLNRILRDNHVQYRQGDTWILYAKYQDKGFTKTKTHTYTDSNGKTQTSMLTVWTEKGRRFIHQVIKSN